MVLRNFWNCLSRRPVSSLGTQLDFAQGRPSGFDYMRLVLAIAVIVSHGAVTVGGSEASHALFLTPLRPVLRAILPMFFALSGFLVAGSLERCRTLISFLGLRVIRIYPALMVEVLLSAFIIGPSVTSVSPARYFASSEFLSYLLNITGDIHYFLPGVFTTNPLPRTVNEQLWTVPYELGCYLSLAFLAVLGIAKRRVLAPIGAFLLCFVHLVYLLVKFRVHYPFEVYSVHGGLLIASFLFGISLYLYREYVPWDARFLGISMALSLALVSVVPAGDYLGVMLLSYVTVWLGLTNMPRIPVIRGADFSYGAYLYGFVIQQLFAYLFPQFRVWWASIVVCVPLALAFAALSWHFVERPALRLKKSIFKFEDMVFPDREGSRPAPFDNR